MNGRQRGFSLIELVIVLVLTGVLGVMVARFIRDPVQGYVNASRRAGLSDAADMAIRKLLRDIRRALPNSVRVTSSGGVAFLELIPTLYGGRYNDAASAGCFTSPGCSALSLVGVFEASLSDYVGDSVVIFNHYSNSGADCSAASLPSVYCGHNRAAISSSTVAAGSGSFGFAAATRFYPSGGSPSRRYQVIDTPVSYACDPLTGRLTRYWDYGFSATQPTSFSSGSNALVAAGLSSCSLTYQTGVLARTGIVLLDLTITDSGESVRLFREAHVNDTP